MSFKTDQFQKIKDAIHLVDKICDFKVDFNEGKMLAYTKNLTTENAIKNALYGLQVEFTEEHTIGVKKFNIKL